MSDKQNGDTSAATTNGEGQKSTANRFVEELAKPPPNTFRQELEDALVLDDSDERDKKLEAVLKAHGFENIPIEELRELINPPLDDKGGSGEDPAGGKPKKPKVDFDFTLYVGKYAITSPSPPVYEMWVDRDGTITFGEKGPAAKTYKATPTAVEDKWWVKWGDLDSDWYAVQFMGQVEGETGSVLTFVGSRHQKSGEKLVTTSFNGKIVKLSIKNDKGETDNATKWLLLGGGGGILLLIGGIYIWRQRVINDPSWQLRQKTNQAKLQTYTAEVKKRRVELMTDTYFRNISNAHVQDFDSRLRTELRQVFEERYKHNDALRLQEKGVPPPEAVDFYNKIDTIPENAAERLTTSSRAAIEANVDAANGSWLDIGETGRENLIEGIQQEIRDRTEQSMARNGEQYGGAADYAIFDAGAFNYAQEANIQAEKELLATETNVADFNTQHEKVFDRLIQLHESLAEAKARNLSAEEYKIRENAYSFEAENLRKQRAHEVFEIENRLTERHVARESAERAKVEFEAKQHELREKRGTERALKDLATHRVVH